MDNATIHHSDRIKSLCADSGVELEYLPPYSPDFNPIEQSFNVLKAWVRRHIDEAAMFRDFGAFMRYTVKAVGAGGAVGWFKESGYAVEE